VAAPASADPNRFRRSLASSATRGGDAVGNVQDVRERLKKVEALRTAGKMAEAVAELMSIAEAYVARGAAVKAVAVLRQAAKISPEAAEIRLALGDVQQQLRMVEDAAREYVAAFEIYERSQHFGDMMQVLGRLLEMDPDNLAGQLELAEHLARAGHNHEAAGLMRTLATTLLRKGSVEDWEKVAERANGLAPTDATLAHDLALHYVRSGRPVLALGKLLKCYESVPNDAELLELVIEALEQLGQREKAAVICRQLIRTFERNGLKDEANRTLEQLYALAPDDERARAYMGVMAPSVQGGTVIELQARTSGIVQLDSAVEVDSAAQERKAAAVPVARSRPGTMALPEADLERLQAAIARQAEEKAAALLQAAPPLPDDAPPLPDEDAPLSIEELMAQVPTAPLSTPAPANRETTPDAAMSAKPVPAIVHAPTAAPAVPAKPAPHVTAPPAPVAAARQVTPAQPPIATAPLPAPSYQTTAAPVRPQSPAYRPTTPMQAPAAIPTPAYRPVTPMQGSQFAAPPPLTGHGAKAVDLTPASSVSQNLRVTHQPALEALSELDDFEPEEPSWDDEAGFESSERTLVEPIDEALLERHGLRIGEQQVPELTMPVTSRSAATATSAEPEDTFNPVAPAQPRSQILPRPRLSRGGAGDAAAAPRDMSRDLGTLDFFIERGFHDSAVALLDQLDQRHPGAPELAGYRRRVETMRRMS
jgi:tetratricopeptide (TPR) repeat protein